MRQRERKRKKEKERKKEGERTALLMTIVGVRAFLLLLFCEGMQSNFRLFAPFFPLNTFYLFFGLSSSKKERGCAKVFSSTPNATTDSLFKARSNHHERHERASSTRGETPPVEKKEARVDGVVGSVPFAVGVNLEVVGVGNVRRFW
mgnify:CR=1 FL=1